MKHSKLLNWKWWNETNWNYTIYAHSNLTSSHLIGCKRLASEVTRGNLRASKLQKFSGGALDERVSHVQFTELCLSTCLLQFTPMLWTMTKIFASIQFGLIANHNYWLGHFQPIYKVILILVPKLHLSPLFFGFNIVVYVNSQHKPCHQIYNLQYTTLIYWYSLGHKFSVKIYPQNEVLYCFILVY